MYDVLLSVASFNVLMSVHVHVNVRKIFRPALVFTIGIYVTQILVAKYIFLQDSGQHLALENR